MQGAGEEAGQLKSFQLAVASSRFSSPPLILISIWNYGFHPRTNGTASFRLWAMEVGPGPSRV
jgi:hypothetical protein